MLTAAAGGVCRVKCLADIAGGVWATSQAVVLTQGEFRWADAHLLIQAEMLELYLAPKLTLQHIIYCLPATN